MSKQILKHLGVFVAGAAVGAAVVILTGRPRLGKLANLP